MIETDCGSIYGEGIYSAALYSWEVCWQQEVCAPIVRISGYAPPPPGNWAWIGCAPITVR